MKTFTLGIILSSALCVGQAVSAHECTASDVAGQYGHTSTGSVVNPPVGPFTAVGHVTFTETGTLSGAQTTSIGGVLVQETFRGTFTVNTDCTGSATVYVYHGATLARTSIINLVWDDHEKEARAIFLTAETNISIQARKMTDD